ncbi:MAG: thiamine pyrophosphate-dependent dehydrogenase E1 component subunit alpha [Dehalococcoidia bacterium]
MDIPKDKLIEMYECMVTIRQFEEGAAGLTRDGRIKGAIHLYVGEEAVAVGACLAVGKDDYIASTHRGHGHLIAKGGDPKRMYAELFGRQDGYCRGKGGSMHIADLDLGILGANGIVGAGPPIAVGAAFAAQYKGERGVSLCFFGDGASNQGTIHEAMNLAAVLKLPVVFICENNLYGEWTRQNRHQTVTDIAERAKAYAMPGVVVDGMDLFAVHEAVTDAVERARRGEGPSLVECKTYRYYDHQGVGDGAADRPTEEMEEWRTRDPILRLRRHLIETETLTEAEIEDIERRVAARIEEAIAFAEASPLPTEDDLLTDVYA